MGEQYRRLQGEYLALRSKTLERLEKQEDSDVARKDMKQVLCMLTSSVHVAIFSTLYIAMILLGSKIVKCPHLRHQNNLYTQLHSHVYIILLMCQSGTYESSHD